MQQLQAKTLPSINVGINSRMIKEVSNGPIFADKVDLIEVGINESGVLKQGIIDYKRLNEFTPLKNKFSIHGPCTRDYYGNQINLGTKSNRNFTIMEQVFKIASFLEAQHIVLHGEKVEYDYREAFLNVIANFKQLSRMAADYSLTLLIENLPTELNIEKVGILPHEVLQVIESVNEYNLKFCFDIGHGTLSANMYSFDVLEYVNKLSPYLYQMHIHDNQGISEVIDEKFGDQHLPLGKGKVQYARIFQAIIRTRVKNTVLELRPKDGRIEALKSIATLRKLQGKKISQ
jgi:sugar phosphate isomerase/epimerase